MFIHENNIDNKIRSNYKGVGAEIKEFKEQHYLPMRKKISGINFDEDKNSFKKFAKLLNLYVDELHKFSKKYEITSQSKFESTFLEEISTYLFSGLKDIREGKLQIYNKNIYAGLKINENYEISVLTKDVDFCIGKKIKISIENQKTQYLIIPAVCVEVKTYLDATMFGEIKSSSKTLVSATPNSKAYVLMGHKEIADAHLIAAKQDSTITEMFALQKEQGAELDAKTLADYYAEIKKSIDEVSIPPVIETPGRLLNRSQEPSRLTYTVQEFN